MAHILHIYSLILCFFSQTWSTWFFPSKWGFIPGRCLAGKCRFGHQQIAIVGEEQSKTGNHPQENIARYPK